MGPSEKLSVDEEYKFVSEHCRWLSKMMTDTFNMFIRLTTAIIGGSIYLGQQQGVSIKGKSLAPLSDLVVGASALVACLLIYEYARARKRYRQRVTILGGKDERGNDRIPKPKPWPYVIELAMAASMIAVAVAFCRFNPLAN
ncbi:MAG: hypothetical protein ACHQAY_20360 [Hyphomicrobiales bacterium]